LKVRAVNIYEPEPAAVRIVTVLDAPRVHSSTLHLPETDMSTPRLDIYASIHKGLRAFMAHSLVRVGRLDPHDPAEVAEVAEEVGALMDICAAHLAHENDVVHPAMESRRPGSAAGAAAEHQEHQRAIASVRDLAARLGGDDEAAHALYHALSVFVAHNFEHMEHEESAHNAVLWDTHSDEEIAALHERILASIPPHEMQLGLRWMLPHMNPAERAGMLREMRRTAPPHVLEGVLGLVRPLLGGRDWRKLSLALGA
jgi:hemerythrin-like domain-containing protein